MILEARINPAPGARQSSSELARDLIGRAAGPGPAPARVALSGRDETAVAALALHLAELGHQVILVPAALPRAARTALLRSAHHLRADKRDLSYRPPLDHREPDGSWRIGLYSSGSSSGQPSAYGFTLEQLSLVARWYAAIYKVTGSSAIVTCLPVSYNFTFIAGLCLAAHSGATLNLSGSPGTVFEDAARMARAADRVVVLANPVILDEAGARGPRLPVNVLIDSGGAPLSAPGIAMLRERLGDVREGYGLTETASLTHFDAEGTSDSLGTVGAAMPGVSCTVVQSDSRPLLSLDSPATGVELYPDGSSGPERSALLTGDLGSVDARGRLRLLGRADDHAIAGRWPRDTLDLIGVRLGTRCALVRHPDPESVEVRVLGRLPPELATAVHAQIREQTGLQAARITVTAERGPLLHSQKMPRVAGESQAG